jgi:hypothetical protein
MSDAVMQNTNTDPVVRIDLAAWCAELSRLCTVNGITSANQVATISALTDAQVAAIVRRYLIKGLVVTP